MIPIDFLPFLSVHIKPLGHDSTKKSTNPQCSGSDPWQPWQLQLLSSMLFQKSQASMSSPQFANGAQMVFFFDKDGKHESISFG